MDDLTLHRVTGCRVGRLMSAIAQARRDAGISQERVGRVLGVSRQTVSNWERHRATPGALHLLALCSLFSISPLTEVDFMLDLTSNWDGYRATSSVRAVELSRLIANRTFIIE